MRQNNTKDQQNNPFNFTGLLFYDEDNRQAV